MANAGSKADDSFRDSISTINKDGKRAWIFAQQPKGRLYDLRTKLTLIYLFVFFTLPFITINGNPLFLINIPKGKFVLFSVVFWPQDFFLFGLGMLIFIIFIALFTVVFGRAFCGWACPQTIFMEGVFRRIEYWIEGDAAQQKMLTKSPWRKDKIIKRGSKHFIFILIAFVIANTFLAYIIGVDELSKIISEPVSKHIGGLISTLIFTGVFYFVFAWFREQVCIVVCPYGRLQGVLLDKNSILVAYDYVRGEKRGKLHKNEQRTNGDCVDCMQCVKVCPTGIDIRNGTQLECINCTACIDACDHMMEKVGFEKGLIRYASENNIAQKTKLKITPRIIAYSAVLCVLILLESFLLISRSDLDVNVIRARGLLYQEQPNNQISNLYNIRLENKTRDAIPVEMKLESHNGEIKLIGNNAVFLKAEDHTQAEFFIYLNRKDIKQRKTKIKIGLFSNHKKIKTVETNFFGPTN